MAAEGEYYSPEFYATLAAVESDHWWFRARNRVLLWVLGTKVGSFHSLLEVGCGTGYVLRRFREAFPHAELFGTDYLEEGLVFARERVPSAVVCQLDVTLMDEAERYDVIGAFDVIEHIDQDERGLGNLARALRPGGALIITVPQHRWLWSVVDEQACHVRRYTQAELVGKVRRAGLQVDYVTSFVSLLVPLMWVARLRARRGSYDPMSEFRLPGWLNSILEAIMRVELGLLKSGVRFPVGGSLLLVAKKKAS